MRQLLPNRYLNQTAREAGVVKRQGKIQLVAFFWTLVLGFAAGPQKTLASLRRSYELETGTTLAPSSFWARFNEPLAAWLKQVVAQLMKKVFEPVPALKGLLAPFADVLATDATLVKLHECLADVFPGRGHAPAGAKLHLVMSVVSRGLKSFTVKGAKHSDQKLLRAGPWLEKKLLLFDLGFYKYGFFAAIDRHKGFFVSRLKHSANPVVVSGEWQGVPLQEVLAHSQETTLDLTVALSFKRRIYRHHQRSDTFEARVVALFDEDSQQWHLYVTNLSASFQPQEIAVLYRARWSVELLFRQLKGACLLEEIPSRQPAAVKAFIYAAMLSWLVSEGLLKELAASLKTQGWVVKAEQWGQIFTQHASRLLTVLIGPWRQRAFWEQRLAWLWEHEAAQPPGKRLSLLEQVEQGVNYAKT